MSIRFENSVPPQRIAVLSGMRTTGLIHPPVPPRIIDVRRRSGSVWLIPAAAVFAAAAILFLFDPSHFSFYPTCAFYKTTGLFCPGCGSLRAMHQLLHGHIWEALRFNSLLVFSAPVVSAIAGVWLWKRWHHQSFSFLVKPSWVWTGAVVLLAFTILRNLPFARTHGLTP